MKKILPLLFTISLFFWACNNDDSTQEEETAKLAALHQELMIVSKVNSESCTNSADWDFQTYTSICGDQQYIIYSKKNKEEFLKKLDFYNKANLAHHKKWGLNCEYILYNSTPNVSVPIKPSGIKCEEGKPVFKYDSQAQ